MSERDLDELAAQVAVTVAPALVTAVQHDDARMVESLLSGLDRQRLYALAVVLAATLAEPDPAPPAPPQTEAEARREDYAFLRRTGASIEEAAERVGITVNNARKHYEPRPEARAA